MADGEAQNGGEPNGERWNDVAGRLLPDRHILPVRVYYEDTDFSGRVYHASYLRFMERGRTDFLRLLGIHHSALKAGEHGASLAFAVRHMEIDFHAPAGIDDLLTVETRPVEAAGARIVLDQQVLLGDRRLIGARVTVAVIDDGGRPRRLPRPIIERLASIGR